MAPTSFAMPMDPDDPADVKAARLVNEVGDKQYTLENELSYLRQFAYDVGTALRRELLHPKGPAGRTARFLILSRELLAKLERISCPVYGCAAFVYQNAFPEFCVNHMDQWVELAGDEKIDPFLAALLVIGWPDDLRPGEAETTEGVSDARERQTDLRDRHREPARQDSRGAAGARRPDCRGGDGSGV